MWLNLYWGEVFQGVELNLLKYFVNFVQNNLIIFEQMIAFAWKSHLINAWIGTPFYKFLDQTK